MTPEGAIVKDFQIDHYIVRPPKNVGLGGGCDK